MNDEILDFIHRRFSVDCNWISGNCYYFAEILLIRFPSGHIVYDPVDGHFLYQSSENRYYDWTGERFYSEKLIDWETYQKIDSLHYSHICRDCIK